MNDNNSIKNKAELNKQYEALMRKCIIGELYYVQKFCPLGIYVLPDSLNYKS